MNRKILASSLIITLAACSGDDSGVRISGGIGSTTTGTTNNGSTSTNNGSTSTNNGSSSTNNGSASTNNNLCSASNSSPDVTGTSTDAPAEELTANHRNGQTFLVWQEVEGAEYHVYRHTSAITSNNLSAAARVTARWGPLDENTSVNLYGSAAAPQNFVINDAGLPLADETGLFVYTTQNNQQGNAYYAITSVIGGSEDTTIVAGLNATTEPVNESVATPRPVLTLSTNAGKGRQYIQYMDYTKWNPTLSGYAYDFAVALPADCDPAIAYPLRVQLHAYGGYGRFVEQSEYNWPVIQLLPSDPGSSLNTTHTWWYGYARDHNYKTQIDEPTTGVVENFTEQRVLASIDFLLDNSEFNIDSELIHVFGNSMGASGALTYGMRYPSVFAGVYASQPMTDYSSDPVFQANFTKLWGSQSSNLPIINNGRNNAAISDYDSTGVWNWMNHQQQLVQRRGDRFAFLMVDHGKADTTIDWQTQGEPIAREFTAARVGFSARAIGGADHGWQSFGAVVKNVFGFGFGDKNGWLYPKSWSFPGIHNATDSGSLFPGTAGDDNHNMNIEWSTINNSFHENIVDQANRYEISVRSTSINQSADITPRNTNQFRPSTGTQCNWTAADIDNNATIGSGAGTVDSDQLLTILSVPILAASGTRLVISCP